MPSHTNFRPGRQGLTCLRGSLLTRPFPHGTCAPCTDEKAPCQGATTYPRMQTADPAGPEARGIAQRCPSGKV